MRGGQQAYHIWVISNALLQRFRFTGWASQGGRTPARTWLFAGPAGDATLQAAALLYSCGAARLWVVTAYMVGGHQGESGHRLNATRGQRCVP